VPIHHWAIQSRLAIELIRDDWFELAHHLAKSENRLQVSDFLRKERPEHSSKGLDWQTAVQMVHQLMGVQPEEEPEEHYHRLEVEYQVFLNS
jgi:hypothetical protein